MSRWSSFINCRFTGLQNEWQISRSKGFLSFDFCHLFEFQTFIFFKCHMLMKGINNNNNLFCTFKNFNVRIHLFVSVRFFFSILKPKRERKKSNKEISVLSHSRADLWLISPTFYERICANILAPKKFKPKM